MGGLTAQPSTRPAARTTLHLHRRVIAFTLPLFDPFRR
jgi:hypothetical protein